MSPTRNPQEGHDNLIRFIRLVPCSWLVTMGLCVIGILLIVLIIKGRSKKNMSVLALLRPSGGSNGPGGSVSKTLCCYRAAYLSMGEALSLLPVPRSAVKHRPHLGQTTDTLPFASFEPITAPRSHQGQGIFFSSFLFGTSLIPPVNCCDCVVIIYIFVKPEWKKLTVFCPRI